jgi:uncharacterized protein YbjT (DUF2867 family)
MENNNKTVLVTGATGRTGGATARQLLSGGWQVRALTRDVNTPAAKSLENVGAELIQGDFENESTLQQAMQDAFGVFSVQVPNDLELEVKHGKRIADLVKSMGVEHLVYSSVGGAERQTGIPHFESKRRVEEHIESLGIPFTILRPAFFMDNFYWRKQDLLEGKFKSIGLDAGKPLQMIASNDIGTFAKIAFENPAEFLGQELEIAGDELTEIQIANEIGRSISRPIEVVPDVNPPMFPDIAVMNAWLNTHGYEADIKGLREIYPELATLKDWLSRNDLVA